MTIARIKTTLLNDPLVFDVVRSDKNRVISKMPLGGWWGKLHDANTWPLIVLPNGRVHLGCNADNDAMVRYGRINLAELELRAGTKFFVDFTAHDENASGHLLVEKVIDIT